MKDIKPWIVEKSTVVLQDRWIKVRSDRCITPQGAVLDPYYTLEYPDWVHLVVFDPDFNVMLIELYRHGTESVNLEVVSGIVDQADESPEATARRELLEETGYTADRFVHLSSLTPNSATHRNRAHCFAVYDARPLQAPDPEEDEHIAFSFYHPEDVMNRIQSGDFFQSIHTAAIHLAFMDAGLLRYHSH